MKNYYLGNIALETMAVCLSFIVDFLALELWRIAFQSNDFIIYVVTVLSTIVLVVATYVSVSELISDIKDYRRNKK